MLLHLNLVIVALFFVGLVVVASAWSRVAREKGRREGAVSFLDACAVEYVAGRDGFEIFNRQINQHAEQLYRFQGFKDARRRRRAAGARG